MPDTCSHVPDNPNNAPPPRPTEGCAECIEAGHHNWVHLRVCQQCGHVGCCDSSPGKHASAHAGDGEHPLVRSYEPGEDWWFCYLDDLAFMIDGAPDAPSYSS